MDLENAFKLRIQNWLDLNPEKLASWSGHGYMARDPGAEVCSKVMRDLYNMERPMSDRLYSILRGDIFSLVQNVDFKTNPDVTLHPLILLHDRNKHVVWQDDRYSSIQSDSARWLLHRSSYQAFSEKRLPDTIFYLKQISVLISSGESLFNLSSFESRIDGFFIWLDSLAPCNESNKIRFRLVTLSRIASILMDYEHIKEVIFPELTNKINESLYSYSSQKTLYMKRLMRQPVSKDVSEWISVALELGFVDSPEHFLADQASEWPIEYIESKPNGTDMCLLYEMSSRLAKKRSISIDSILLSGKSSSNLYSAFKAADVPKKFHKSLSFNNILSKLIGLLMLKGFTELEALCLLRGNRDIQKDSRDNYVVLDEGELEFFCCLRELGLQPYKPSMEEIEELFKKKEENVGVCLKVVNDPHVIRYVPRAICEDGRRLRHVIQELKSWRNNLIPFCVILWSRNMKSAERMSPFALRSSIEEVAAKGNRVAEMICRHF